MFEPCAELDSVLIQHLTKSKTYETLKRPMKQVQGMVQGDRLGLFTRPSFLVANTVLLTPGNKNFFRLR